MRAAASQPPLKPLQQLVFDNRAIRALPFEKNVGKARMQRNTPGVVYHVAKPTPVVNPKLVCVSPDVLTGLLDIAPEEFDKPETAAVLCGSAEWQGSETAAHAYAGHQFGYFSGQLGDGATMYAGEVVNSRGQRLEVQFKGAGLTPYSRTADGRKVLRSSIREFLGCEALDGLHVPTARSGSVVVSFDTQVVRDILYDGHPRREPTAIITRIAPTFLRFGSFEIARPTDPATGRAGPSFGLPDIVGTLVKYTMESFFEPEHQVSVVAWAKEVVRRTAVLMAKWQLCGFVNGVLNTDNQAILGFTLDLGPFGFMERMNPKWTPNRSDDRGRYTYRNQPGIAKWNCFKLMESLFLADLLQKEDAEHVLEAFTPAYERAYLAGAREKLGISPKPAKDEADLELFESLLKIMESSAADFTQTFWSLALLFDSRDPERFFDRHVGPKLGPVSALQELSKPPVDPNDVHTLRVLLDSGDTATLSAHGITREVVESAEKKLSEWQTERDALMQLTPEAKLARDRELWLPWLRQYVARLEEDQERERAGLRATMVGRANPYFVLRNSVAQRCIDFAVRGEFSEVRHVLGLCRSPFADPATVAEGGPWVAPDGYNYCQPSPDPAAAMPVS